LIFAEKTPTVQADFLLIGNVTQLQLESKTVSWAQVTGKSSIFEITDVPVTPAVFSANINQWATGASAEDSICQYDSLDIIWGKKPDIVYIATRYLGVRYLIRLTYDTRPSTKRLNIINIKQPVLVSDTNFATIALALADDAVKTAHAGDFVEITGDIYHVIKTNPTVQLSSC
jgi:hypothetical protein